MYLCPHAVAWADVEPALIESSNSLAQVSSSGSEPAESDLRRDSLD